MHYWLPHVTGSLSDRIQSTPGNRDVEGIYCAGLKLDCEAESISLQMIIVAYLQCFEIQSLREGKREFGGSPVAARVPGKSLVLLTISMTRSSKTQSLVL